MEEENSVYAVEISRSLSMSKAWAAIGGPADVCSLCYLR